MSLVLVVARPGTLAPRAEGASARTAGDESPPANPGNGGRARDVLWRDVRREVAHLREERHRAVVGGRLDELAARFDAEPDEPTVAYAASCVEALRAVEASIAAGASSIAVLPVALAAEDAEGSLAGPDAAELEALGRGLDDLGHRYPGVELAYVGPPFDDPPALEAAIAALRPSGSEEPALFAASVERGFGGDLDRFARFMAVLQGALPPDTRLVLRGSAVQGESYKTGEPFDARGPGTSDLDIVLLGEAAMDAWLPDAFYVPGVNTKPLWDEARDVAPGLEAARAAAQEIAGRPVALQAMARWFLDLRSGLQGTPYVTLGG